MISSMQIEQAIWVIFHHIEYMFCKKNAVYPWHSKLSLMSGDTLRIRAEYGGAGSIPQIWLYDEVGNIRPPEAMVVTSAASNNNVISLKNLLISGFGEYDYRELDGINTSLLSIHGESSIYIDSCILKSTNASHIRIDNGYVKVMKVTNSIFADMGFLVHRACWKGKRLTSNQEEQFMHCREQYICKLAIQYY